MKRIILTTASLLWWGMSVSLGEGDYHTFTDVFGQKTEARILRVEGGQVSLEEKDGGKLKMALKSLPEDEQRAVREWMKSGELRRMPAGSGIAKKESKRKAVKQKPAKKKAAPYEWTKDERQLNAEILRLHAEGKFSEAIPLAETLVKLSEKSRGAIHPKTGISLEKLAELYELTGRYEEAEPLFERALSIHEKVLGPDHPSTARSLGMLASLYHSTGRYEEAEPLFEQALAIDEKALGPDHRATAAILINLGLLYADMARFEEAEPLVRRALSIHEKALGPDHPDTASSLNILAFLYDEMGRYEEAEPLYERALAIREVELGPDHSFTAASLNNLAGIYYSTSRYEEAEPLYKRSLMIYEKALGPDHPETATSLNNLAELYVTMGRYEEAEPLYERALAISEKALGPDHPSTAISLNNLTAFYYSTGRYEEAEPLYKRSLMIYEKALGPDHPDTALSLNNLANLYDNIGRIEEAEPLYERALAISEKKLGPDHPGTATSLSNLAGIYYSMVRYDDAEPLYERALAISEKKLGPDHPATASSLNNLASLYNGMGRNEEAEPLFERALAIHEKALGPDHPDTATSLSNLALIKIDLEEAGLARSLAVRELTAKTSHLSKILSFTSESERLAFQQTLEPFNLIASLEAAAETAEVVLRQKGIVLESLIEDRRLAQAGDNPALTGIFQEMQANRSILRRVRLQGGASGMSGKEIEALEETFRDQEKELARSVAGLGGARASLALKVEDVASSIPAGAALVEYFRYDRYTGTKNWQPSYGAVLIQNGKEPALAWCGKADAIESDIHSFGNALANVDEEGLKEVSHRLHATLLGPLLTHLEGVETLLISPDAQLGFVPFAALLDGDGRFAGESFEIGYVAGGRDLVKKTEPLSDSPGLLVGGPNFGMKSEDRLLAQAHVAGTVKRDVRTDDLEFMELVPLEAAEKEADRVEKALGGGRILTRGEATESAIRSVTSPRVLHLATHGFFLKEIDVGGGANDPRQRIGIGGEARTPIVNPMYRSGIALAGAQTTIDQWRKGIVPDPDNDGILMAAEVGDLDLRGTDLVTLSACSTATGEALSGEGVLGLRRGFVMAGARNLLMTLWPVADEDTADFMEDFYTRYAKTGNAPKSLAEVQREWLVRLREEKGLVHAVNRAGAFIMSSQGRVD